MRIISGIYKSRKILSPSGSATRPTADKNKENLFNILNSIDPEMLSNSVVADLFAGSGALGIEAISRGAKRCCFIDNDRDANKIIQKNLKNLGCIDKAEIIKADIKKFRLLEEFDVVFADPPYNKNLAENIFACLQDKLKSYLIIEEENKATISTPSWLDLVKQKNYGNTSFYIYKTIMEK